MNNQVTSWGIVPTFKIELHDILERKHLPPLGLKDFEEWLLFVERSPQDLYAFNLPPSLLLISLPQVFHSLAQRIHLEIQHLGPTVSPTTTNPLLFRNQQPVPPFNRKSSRSFILLTFKSQQHHYHNHLLNPQSAPLPHTQHSFKILPIPISPKQALHSPSAVSLTTVLCSLSPTAAHFPDPPFPTPFSRSRSTSTLASEENILPSEVYDGHALAAPSLVSSLLCESERDFPDTQWAL